MSTTNHPFRKNGKDDLRSSCPGLNALSNHSYIRHDGKDITFSQLSKALQDVYGLSFILAMILSSIAVVLCGHLLRGTFDLDALLVHNVLEHDASLVHDDAPCGKTWASSEVDSQLLQDLLSCSKDKETLSQEDFLNFRVSRELSSPLCSSQQTAALAELAVILKVFGEGSENRISLTHIREFLGEERIPKEWSKKQRPTGFMACQLLIRKLKACMKKKKMACKTCKTASHSGSTL